MAKRTRTRGATDRTQYAVDTEWTKADLALLEELKRAEALLPDDAPRALLSVRLSVLTDETTSPVRQELDLRMLARERGSRVVGVASDLNVSATKVPPWRRKELGSWLNNRAPEFDEILFWKLDRFVRRLSDLSTVIDWCLKYGKNLVSKNDSIDLTTTAGKIMVTIVGGIAEIEAANTSTRVASLWEYTKTQSEWLVGKPAYGYETAVDGDGKTILVINETAYRALHWSRKAAMRERPASARRMVKVLVRASLCESSLTASTHLRRLRNPALMGYRVEEEKNGGVRRSKIVLRSDGKPIRVAEGVFTEDEFYSLQEVLDGNGKNQPTRNPEGATRFLGVLICHDCVTNMTVQKTRSKGRSYEYLRCGKCKGGGQGAPNPEGVYGRLVDDVLKVLGDEPVMTREYRQGAETRKEQQRLEQSVSYYMTGLEPGGRFTKTQFTQEQAEKTLDDLIKQLQAIDPESTKDRWVAVHNGKTFRERWEEGGMEAMAADLLRVGVKCEIKRTRVKGVRAPHIHMKLMIPKNVRDRLILKEDDFAQAF
ncbi:serine recombinase [Streptomyces cellostaticus]|uniref:Serine recombinase n=1 Tax=Streptomyces cellostaticus TaxID=67285 RepID=A0A101NFA4_9ACTN|nr:recombinase family protein [Streptomyces cellostaticus]KUM92070.1 serine recombinase [Streptomyces cellostaticus]GHI07761.1 integrase [Streptomyces cellostaticus]